MTAIDKSEILKEIKLLKGVSDNAQDDLLNLTIKESTERILAFVNRYSETSITEIPNNAAYIVRDVAVKRFNKLNSEGTKADSEEGRAFTWEDNYLSEDDKQVLMSLATKKRARGIARFI
jgi:DNA packaging protein, QLRG family|nr:MAG TPA: PORTAL PROTEIN, 15 PROTEIN, HEAD PROTEIN, VIRAL INFECTION, TAILED.2A [Caudoviricetes sp.]DAL03842.1 MAG TPA: PORTAL PROTEIN, 15 PROTEIN, HEAD PROTEIN, VIRAL INFECTION, TAILED.2A [Caudoviricetes sp.]DAX18930.1 MAG TPA: PORTAL PROTEIN, 15 PROTEIN, HEAD PROTEIN, VIRAL INFECTION, TAILED.2A [Bacteriophage sp.]